MTITLCDKRCDKAKALAMEQIDAATAVMILVAAAPAGTAEPLHKAMKFIERAARLGRVQVRAFRSHATDRRETVPAVEVADLAFDFMAGASRENEYLPIGEAKLVAGGSPYFQGFSEGLPRTVWRRVRFLRREIEGAKADFLAWLEGRQIEAEAPASQSIQRALKGEAIEIARVEGREIEPGTPPALPPQRKRRQSMQAEIEQFLVKLYKDGPPEWWDWPLTRFCLEVRKLRAFNVGNDTIKRARRAVANRGK
jgi:hypothetical protein